MRSHILSSTGLNSHSWFYNEEMGVGLKISCIKVKMTLFSQIKSKVYVNSNISRSS